MALEDRYHINDRGKCTLRNEQRECERTGNKCTPIGCMYFSEQYKCKIAFFEKENKCLNEQRIEIALPFGGIVYKNE